MILRIINGIQRRYQPLKSVIRRYILNMHPAILIKKNSIIERDVRFNTMHGGRIKIGKNCELRKGVQLLTYGGNIILGDYCSINPYTIIYGQGNIIIGNGVRIAAHCVLIPSNHNFNKKDIFIYQQGLTNQGIEIQDDVWLGTGVRVLDGVSITKGCIIGAGSVVTKSTEPYSVYVGVPARKIKDR